MAIRSLFLALGFSFIHYASSQIDCKKSALNKFTSFVGGISISYVFFHLLPTISAYQGDVAETFNLGSSMSAYYLLFGAALAGLVVFYLLETYAGFAKTNVDASLNQPSKNNVFWAHMGSYFIYNGIIGVLLTEQRFETWIAALLYLSAIGLHFVTNDWNLHHHFEASYNKYGRNLLCGAVLLGWLVGILFHLNHVAIAFLEAFVAGGMMLNAIKDELPKEKERNIPSFLTGIIGYSLILMFI